MLLLLNSCKKDSPAPTIAPPNASFTLNSSSSFAPDTVVFSNNSKNATNYLWDFGDGSTISTLENPTHIYTNRGAYTVKLTAKNSIGSSIDTSVLLVVAKTNVSVTLGTSTYPLNGSASAILLNNGDSLNIVNSSSTIPANIESTTANTVIISLNTPNPITAGTTYTAGFGVNTELVGFFNTGVLYVGGATRSGLATNVTVKIATLTLTNVTGTYSGTVFNSTDFTTRTISGNFNANF